MYCTRCGQLAGSFFGLKYFSRAGEVAPVTTPVVVSGMYGGTILPWDGLYRSGRKLVAQ